MSPRPSSIAVDPRGHADLALHTAQAFDISRYHSTVSDVLIRDLPDDVLAGIDARAAELGLSRVEDIRRRQDLHVTR